MKAFWQDVTEEYGCPYTSKCEVLLDLRNEWLAQVEDSVGNGHWYGNAVDLVGIFHRSGPMITYEACRDWCENMAGVRPKH